MNIASIVNFVRAVEPREKDDSYLPATLIEELKLCNQYDFPSTVLLQYDAFILPEYQNILKEYGRKIEIGLWFEVVRPMAEDAGMIWHGRWDWDWHNDVGFLIGYTPDERIKLIDQAFKKYKEIFGSYPEVVGSWHIDAFSLAYMKDRYDVKASCNCKDQCGTDGYTIWGGFYAGAYYPSRTNMMCPASNEDTKIDMPIFRMLGSDPIHQYNLGLGHPEERQSVMSMEPIYGNSGSDRDWVEWYMKETYNNKTLALSFTQFGQENPFGWQAIKAGLPMQFEILSRMQKQNRLEVIPLGEAAKRYTERYTDTVPVSICVDSDCLPTDFKTVWYMSKFYRANTLYQKGKLFIRDMFTFHDRYEELYLHDKVHTDTCYFENLPIMDGFRFSGPDQTAGIYPVKNQEDVVFGGPYLSETVNQSVTLTLSDELKILFEANRFTIYAKDRDIIWIFRTAQMKDTSYTLVSDREVRLTHCGFSYSIRLETGIFKDSPDGLTMLPQDGTIILLPNPQ